MNPSGIRIVQITVPTSMKTKHRILTWTMCFCDSLIRIVGRPAIVLSCPSLLPSSLIGRHPKNSTRKTKERPAKSTARNRYQKSPFFSLVFESVDILSNHFDDWSSQLLISS
mmetsp:Transcript_15926/g.32641  ORF Transcript_15926/g.32641 Transcript_15926/m.32641 type:complete len:112 (+) Transcript_15926:572-907(+)